MSPDRQDALSPIPTPKNLYVHDDLSDAVRGDFESYRLVGRLFGLLQSDSRVRVLTEEEQIDGLLAQGDHKPFETTVAIGDAGAEVAKRLHDRTGWFPEISTIDIHREEDNEDGYVLAGASGLSLDDQLAFVDGSQSTAVVDNTLFSGLTIRAVVKACPKDALDHTHAFCLRGVAETAPSVDALCPITLGFAAEGRIDDDVSFINASGLVTRVGIKRVGRPPLTFFERPEWMHAWFPGYAGEVIDLCRRLNTLLEPR